MKNNCPCHTSSHRLHNIARLGTGPYLPPPGQYCTFPTSHRLHNIARLGTGLIRAAPIVRHAEIVAHLMRHGAHTVRLPVRSLAAHVHVAGAVEAAHHLGRSRGESSAQQQHRGDQATHSGVAVEVPAGEHIMIFRVIPPASTSFRATPPPSNS